MSDSYEPFVKKPVYVDNIYGDFRPFYIVITICTVLGFALFLLNIIFCCCSRYKDYWQNSDTGNRWIVSIWTKTPTKQPPLDYSELENCTIPSGSTTYDTHFLTSTEQPQFAYSEFEGSTTHSPPSAFDTVPPSGEEYLELQRRRECEV